MSLLFAYFLAYQQLAMLLAMLSSSPPFRGPFQLMFHIDKEK
ncbi:hypothetical protein Tco_0694678, partial [Tanacetum coccineum]